MFFVFVEDVCGECYYWGMWVLFVGFLGVELFGGGEVV